MTTQFQQARAQCIRALDIIDTTQLTVFLQRDLETRAETLQKIDALENASNENAVLGMRKMLNTILASYNDPFANYIDPKQHKAYSSRRSGGFVGLGIKFRAFTNGYPKAIGALLGGPLEHADIQPGDLIVKAGHKDLKGFLSRDVANALAGKPDSVLRLTLKRGSAPEHYVDATRQSVQLHYVRSSVLDDQLGYLKLTRFGGNSHKRFKEHLSALLAKNVRGLILDLRDNPGGSTRAARNILSMFDKAPWVYCEQYKNTTVKRLPREGEWMTDLPLAVLINENSMSSSEILAGALQDYKRATIVGAPSYGKGLIQKVFALQAPLGGAIRTTIAMYGTPSHRLIHGRGLIPDIYVPTAPHGLFKETGSVNVTDEAREFRRSLLLDRLHEELPKSEADAYSRLKDTQLQIAKDALERS